jgi:hypothetical protein
MSTEKDIKGLDSTMWWVSIMVCVLSLVLLIFSQACIWIGRMFLIPSDFVVHSFRPPMEEAMSRLWSQLG